MTQSKFEFQNLTSITGILSYRDAPPTPILMEQPLKFDLHKLVEYATEEEKAIEDLWDSLFAASQDMLSEWASEALAEHRAGKTIPVDRKK